MKLRHILLSVITLAFISCSDSSPVLSLDSGMQYPLTVGNQWTYSSSHTYTNFVGERPQNIEDHVDTLMVTVIRGTTINNISVFEVKEETIASPYPFMLTGSKYLQNESDGLKEVAIDNGVSSCLPKSGSRQYFRFMDQAYSSIEELLNSIEQNTTYSLAKTDSVRIHQTPRTIYSYPFEDGKEWNYASGSWSIINKRIVGEERVSTAAGEFDCYKIRWLYNSSDIELLYFDYVSEKGLIKREIIIKDLTVATPERPDGVGTCDYKQEVKLVEINF